MVGGFRVVKIDAKQVVVERDGVQITLWMK
jgi:hypothetical protein